MLFQTVYRLCPVTMFVGMGQTLQGHCLPWSNQVQCHLTEAYPALRVYLQAHIHRRVSWRMQELSWFYPFNWSLLLSLGKSWIFNGSLFSTFADLALLPSLVFNPSACHVNPLSSQIHNLFLTFSAGPKTLCMLSQLLESIGQLYPTATHSPCTGVS